MTLHGYPLHAMFALLLLPLIGTSARSQRSDTGAHGHQVPGRSVLADAFARADRLSFVENRGQVTDRRGRPRPDVLFTSGAGEGKLFFRKGGISYLFTRPREGGGEVMRAAIDGRARIDRPVAEGYRMDMELVGADTDARVTAEAPTGDHANFYTPHTPGGITGVGAYHEIIYHDIYPGIDLRFHGGDHGLKYDFIVGPGGDPSRIRLRYHGASTITTTRDGMLRAATPLGAIIDGTPFSYQLPEGEPDLPAARGEVRCRWRVSGSDACFIVGDYDRSRTLVIDPTLLWATYFGGMSAEAFYGYYAGITVDADGNIAISGLTMSNDLPVTRGAIFEYGSGDYDAFAAKFDGSGKRLWATYYGGKDLDIARGIDAGTSTDLAICGYTRSIDFPLGPAPWQPVNKGGADAFVLKLDGNGRRLWATYFGGNDTDIAHAVAVDPQGNMAITGATLSRDFPLTPGAFQMTFAGTGASHAFIAKLHADGGMIWSTFYGGSDADRGNAIAAGADGSLAIAGITASPDLPIPRTAHQPNRAGDRDAFVTLFEADGRQRWGSYMGGDSLDEANGVAITPDGNVVTCGVTESATFPTTADALQPRYAGPGSDAFIMKFDGNGTLLWGTYYGGSAYEMALGIRASGWGNIYVTGLTISTDFPLPADAYQPLKEGNTDAFLIELDADGKRVWGTYYGGENLDVGSAVAVDNARNIYIAGATERSLLPGTSRGYQKSPSLENDAFIAKFGDGCGVRNPSLAPGGLIDHCSGDTVTLTAPEGYGYLWEPTGETTRSIRVTTTNDYRVILTAPSGCLDTSRWVKVREQYRPSVKITSSATAICEGERVTLRAQATGATGIRWSTGDTTTIITVTRGGTYTVTADGLFGCSGSASATITLNPKPHGVITGASSACVHTTLRYGTTSGADLIHAWSVSGGGAIMTAADGGNIDIRWEEAGANTITLVTTDTTTGCSSTTTLNVEVGSTLKPVITPGGPIDICEGESVTLDAGEGYASYRWSTGESTRTIVVHATGSHSVAVTDITGCGGTSDDVIVITSPPPAPVIEGQTSVCVNSSMQYTTHGSPRHGYAWSVTGGTIIAGQGTPSITVLWQQEPGGRVELRETIGSFGCAGSATPVDVVVGPRRIVTIAPKPPIDICEGESMTLEAAAGFDEYLWSTGERTRSIVVRLSAVYAVYATDANGCTGIDSVAVRMHQRPAPRISYTGSTTLYEGGRIVLDAGNESYLRRWSTGDTTRTITVRESGDYAVSMTGPYGCVGVSDTVHITVIPIPRGETLITLPEMEAAPGDTIVVPIRLESSRYLSLRPTIRYNGVLRVNATLLRPIGITQHPTLDKGEWSIGFGGLLRDTLGTLAEMKFLALLGDSDRAPLRLASFAWSDSTIDATVIAGEVKLLVCRSDGGRTVAAGGALALKAIRPDPVRDGAEIEYELIENGPVRLTISDMLGREAVVLADEQGSPGPHTARLDASSLPSGIYVVTLSTATGHRSALMRVVK